MDARRYRYGLKPPRAGAVKMKLRDYVRSSAPVAFPKSLGHPNIVYPYHILGNDEVGNCLWAGAAHETYLWTAATGSRAHISTWDTFDDYRDCCGFEYGNEATDQGTDIQEGASYRRKTGIRDARDDRHKIGAYVEIEPGNISEMVFAVEKFMLCGLGVTIGDNQQAQFEAGQPWDGDPGPNPGGHYIPLVGAVDGVPHIVTWGKLHPVTVSFLEKQCDQALAYLSTEMLIAGKSLDGFDLAQLQDDLTQLTKGSQS